MANCEWRIADCGFGPAGETACGGQRAFVTRAAIEEEVASAFSKEYGEWLELFERDVRAGVFLHPGLVLEEARVAGNRARRRPVLVTCRESGELAAVAALIPKEIRVGRWGLTGALPGYAVAGKQFLVDRTRAESGDALRESLRADRATRGVLARVVLLTRLRQLVRQGRNGISDFGFRTSD